MIFVHGLGGDSVQTWTHGGTGSYWPRDFLPEDIPEARVMTFDYNGAAAFGRSTADIADHAKALLAGVLDKRENDDGTVSY